MLTLIFMILGGIGLGVLITYLYLKPKVNATQELDLETQKKNQELHAELLCLIEKNATLTAQKDEIVKSIKTLSDQAEKSSTTIFEQSFQIANEKMSAAADKLSAEYEEAKSKMEQEFIELMASNTASFTKELSATQHAIKLAEARLADLSSKVMAATEAAKRQEELDTAQDFYKLNLSEIDIDEIKKLREVTAILRDSEPLNKVIWKVYYEKPYTDLIGRVIGAGVHTGIYKITNIENQKCYVGQAANLADRWRQHIKRGIGAEAPTRNKLYPAMLKFGIENFTFEVVEECSRELLNEREDYWQEYFGAKEFGYSIK